ncbi:MAG: phosphatidate cytidylyltransferase [Gammaproteobacteria bacterium]|nr:phosphatidate cytidylyltransferase [Gammaproteobacteria bacterium]
MLLHRILTAVPLAMAVIWLILYQPTENLLFVLIPVSFICGYEWARLGGLQSSAAQLAFALLLSAFSWLCINYFSQYGYLLLLLATAWWFAVLVFLKKVRPELKSSVVSPAKLLVAFMVVPSAMSSIYIIHGIERGAEWLLYSMVLVWIADSGAYFAGKKFGKNKLAPNVSPGKTLEGLWGALIASTIYSVIASYYFNLTHSQSLLLIGLSLLLTIMSVAGDLYESFLKREAGVKDSGRILPGHGGILDRIDGVLPVMPLFVVFYDWLIMPVEGLYW